MRIIGPFQLPEERAQEDHMATSVPRGKAAVLPDEVLREAGLKPRREWGEKEWLTFLAGWARQRLNTPKAPEHEPHTKYFAFGFREAEHFQPAVAA